MKMDIKDMIKQAVVLMEMQKAFMERVDKIVTESGIPVEEFKSRVVIHHYKDRYANGEVKRLCIDGEFKLASVAFAGDDGLEGGITEEDPLAEGGTLRFGKVGERDEVEEKVNSVHMTHEEGNA